MENNSFAHSFTSDYSTPTVSTDDETLEFLGYSHMVMLCTLLGVASVVGTFGNALVLLSIIRFEELKSIPDLFISSLSLSDILVTTLYQPLKAYRLAHLQQISTNVTYMTISSFLGYFSLITSITNMFAVTVERLISIRFPLKYDLLVTKRRAIVTVICIWVFSVTYGAIESRDYISKLYISMYFILSITGTVLIYVYLFFIAKRLEAAVIQVQSISFAEARSNSRKERKAAKTIAIILGVAIACWLPFLIVPHLLSKNADRGRGIFFSLQALSVCNSSVNPYIYCARCRRYYVAFFKLLGLQKAARTRAPVTPVYSARNGSVDHQLT